MNCEYVGLVILLHSFPWLNLNIRLSQDNIHITCENAFGKSKNVQSALNMTNYFEIDSADYYLILGHKPVTCFMKAEPCVNAEPMELIV